ncbi:MAG: DUF58 domain-containing protein [Microbacteriaceae bacterium]|nr:DUF58 domain-containing protein [Microbacteriaceae bacterium]
MKSRLHLRARRAATHLLDGQYASIHRGRSLDFTDLRDYVVGDEVADIDWKATARTGEPLVRRSAAERRHRVLFALDTGRDLAARSANGEPKRDIAVEAVGVLGWLALRHGDEVGLVLGDAEGLEQLPFRAGEAALERGLRRLHDRPRLDGPRSDLAEVLERVRRTVRHRTLLVVVADETEFDDRIAGLVSTLAAQHEVVWLELADADLGRAAATGRPVYDVDGGWSLPAMLHGDRRLRAEADAAAAERRERMRAHFDRHAVSTARLGARDEVVGELLAMLKARRHARG